ncbi:MAG: TIGR01777 family oxidoreductase [Solirubrobacteraceae bacterium]
MARVLVTGATGLIGGALIDRLNARGDQVVALTRDPGHSGATLAGRAELHGWAQPTETAPPRAALSGLDGVVHLLGEPIAQRWSEEVKRQIRDSRVLPTRRLVSALCELPDDGRPGVLVSQSATGYYGARGPEPLDETAAPGDDFLSQVVVAWEREASQAGGAMRVVNTRTGVVLAPGGGALAKMLPFFRLGIGGPVAGGRQYVPWIHLDDIVGAILRCLDDGTLSGPVNLTAPQSVTNAQLSTALGRALRRPAILPVPAFALRALYGEMAQVVTTGSRVVPAELQRAGYEFERPDLEPALRDLLGS